LDYKIGLDLCGLAIAEALQRPPIKFVATKTLEFGDPMRFERVYLAR
jgi:hypothetical protein